MNDASGIPARSFTWCLFVLGAFLSTAGRAEKVLFDFEGNIGLTVEARDATVEYGEHKDGRVLRLSTGHIRDWPGITLEAPDGRWDLSKFAHVAVDVANVGTNQVDVNIRLDTPDHEGKRIWVTGKASLEPGEKKTVTVALKRRLPPQLESKIFGMRGYPGGFEKGKGIDAANIDQLRIFVHHPLEDHTLEIDNIRAAGSYDATQWLTLGDDEVFPIIDRFGQFVHKSWPGKVESADDFPRRKEAEAADLARRPGPETWNQYGGWEAGPQLKATGRFRVEKREGYWWLVDPEGRLFWSHGADCIRSTSGYTPITDREFLFADLPDRDSPFGEFYGRGSWAPHGYYQGKRYETYNFTGANLLEKYGPDWKAQFGDLCHRRLRSWGMNTIGNWSDSGVYLARKTPYVATVGAGKKPLEGSSGYWGKFPDVFDPDFRETLAKRLAAEKGKTVGDPWCIGYFVDNELAWGDELSLALATLASPAEQAAKKALLAELRAKYDAIEMLNAAWGTKHASWHAFLESTTPPNPETARGDLAAFYTTTAERYFRTCSEAVKKVDRHALYLGCRFAWVNDRAVHAAAKYCDIVSFNRYQPSVADFRLPEGVDKPAIIGEFHFGALDRGMFHTGLQPVADQAARAAAYTSYVEGALANRWLIGTHWFQYGEQATTGRGDGENYQIGLLDVGDTPYPEIIEASRAVGAKMYRLRLTTAEPFWSP
jgi:hypothetical protein